MPYYRIAPDRHRPNGWHLADAFGIPVIVEPSHLFLPLLILLQARNLVEGLLYYLVLFLSVLAHELGHGLVARRMGCRRIFISFTMFFGLTHHEPTTRGKSLAIVLAGPAVSLALGAAAYALAGLEGILRFGNPEGTILVLGILVFVNLIWGAFNLVPIYPLDGGQALFHALGYRMPEARALVLVAKISMVLAVVATWLLYQAGLPFAILVMGMAFLTNFQILSAYNRR